MFDGLEKDERVALKALNVIAYNSNKEYYKSYDIPMTSKVLKDSFEKGIVVEFETTLSEEELQNIAEIVLL